MRFAYAQTWLDDASRPAISFSLPKRQRAFSLRECRPFFTGILPEGWQRRAVAEVLGLSRTNDFALLDALGGDVAGALAFWPEGETPQAPRPGEKQRPLTDAELKKVLKSLPARPLLAGREGFRLSLAGAQTKLPVVLCNGRVALPGPGEPHDAHRQARHLPPPAYRRERSLRHDTCHLDRPSHGRGGRPRRPRDVLSAGHSFGGGVFRNELGASEVSLVGPRSARFTQFREAPQPRRNSWASRPLATLLVVSVVVVSALALVTECLSPEDLALPVGRSAGGASVRALRSTRLPRPGNGRCRQGSSPRPAVASAPGSWGK